MASFQLYPFQKEACLSLWEAARRARQAAEESDGKSPAVRVLCCQPTGAGKTIEILCFAEALFKRWGWRALVVEPTRELVNQTVEKAERVTPELKVGVVRGGRREFDDLNLVVSTAGSLHPKALAEIDPAQFQVVIIDECHHGAATSYELILAHFSDVMLIVGVTATAQRGDGVAITGPKYFHSVIVYHTIGQLTSAGFLTKARGHYKHTGVTLENVPIRGGQFDERKLAHACNIPERNAMAVDAYEEFAKGRLAFGFAVDIQHARDAAASFNARGIPAAAVWGQMDQTEYARAMDNFRAGKIRVLCNARLLTEGVDIPQVSAVLIMRPATEASGKVLGPQMIGRGLRLAPGKEDSVIIELVDKAILSGSRGGKDKPLGVSSLLASAYDVPREQIEKGDGFLHEQARRARVEEGWRERAKLYQSLRSEEAVQETFDVIERVSQVSEFAWIPLGAKTYYMNIGNGRFIEVVAEHDRYYEVRAIEESELKFIGFGTDLKSAIQIADAWLARSGINYMLQHRSQPWRQKDPTDSQIVAARRLTGLQERFLKGLKRGQLSDLIASATALLIPAEQLKLSSDTTGKLKPVEVGALSQTPSQLHVWQFGRND